jgi:hypothetical protein
MKRLINKLAKAKGQYDAAIGELEASVKDKIGFDFSIDYQPSDGFVVLNYETSSLAPLDFCIDKINKKGFLSEDDHYGLCI